MRFIRHGRQLTLPNESVLMTVLLCGRWVIHRLHLLGRNRHAKGAKILEISFSPRRDPLHRDATLEIDRSWPAPNPS
jgi:hypothetical protein